MTEVHEVDQGLLVVGVLEDLGERFHASGFRVLGFQGLGFRVLGFRDLGFRVLGFRDLGFRV